MARSVCESVLAVYLTCLLVGLRQPTHRHPAKSELKGGLTKQATKHVSIHMPLCATGGGTDTGMGCGLSWSFWELGACRVMQYACNETIEPQIQTCHCVSRHFNAYFTFGHAHPHTHELTNKSVHPQVFAHTAMFTLICLHTQLNCILHPY